MEITTQRNYAAGCKSDTLATPFPTMGMLTKRAFGEFGKSHPIVEAVFIFGRKDSRKILQLRIKRQFQKL
jgi:hypothetical protein